ncbi:hypothetical protein VTN00DRAFT_386 [Thermoascus crustaceus]|uniref:uncharacterized protein n=1 Tax=Thermoascus crustaceus TaxID=5088 RepID=UPI0037436A39
MLDCPPFEQENAPGAFLLKRLTQSSTKLHISLFGILLDAALLCIRLPPLVQKVTTCERHNSDLLYPFPGRMARMGAVCYLMTLPLAKNVWYVRMWVVPLLFVRRLYGHENSVSPWPYFALP